MSLNPLAQVTDYQSMLNRIFVFTLIIVSLCIWALRQHYEWLEEVFSKINLSIDFQAGPIKVEKSKELLSHVLPALVVAFVARQIKLHDRISDLLRIRQRFDVNVILKSFAARCGFRAPDMEALKKSRRPLMGKLFYRYASSTDPKIDKHLIYQALDWWSWYWVIVEGLFFLIPTSVALLWTPPRLAGQLCLAVCLLGILGLIFFRRKCVRYAEDEVAEILSDGPRKAEAAKELNEIFY